MKRGMQAEPGLIESAKEWKRGRGLGCGWALVWVIVGWMGWRAKAELLSIPPFAPDPAQVERLQRTLTLMQNATPTNRPTLRLLIYGQSHSVNQWWWKVWHALIARYPNVNIVATNRAIVGLDAAGLSRTCVADIGPWQPDLVFLHCYGSNLDDFHRLYRTVRETCVADVVVHPEHPMTATEAFEEPSVPLEDPYPSVAYYRNYLWLPPIANEYGHCWADTRTPWKEYLSVHQLSPKTLLQEDLFHTNDDGTTLTKEYLMKFFEPRTFATTMDPWNNSRVRTLAVGDGLKWVDGALDVQVYGNRVDVVYEAALDDNPTEFRYTVDGVSPAERPEFLGYDRASSPFAASPMPGVLQVGNTAPLAPETWTLKTESIEANGADATFAVYGSVTGFDGRGSVSKPFESNSKRVVIAPGMVMTAWAYRVTQKLPPEDFEITWQAARRFKERFRPAPPEHAQGEPTETLFVSAVESSHRIRISPVESGRATRGIRAIRVYSPSGAASVVDGQRTLMAQRSGAGLKLFWPREWGKGRIESASGFAAGVSWSVESGEVTLADGWYQMKTGGDLASGASRYFRWRPEGASER